MQPKMTTQTYNILKNWKQYPRNMVQMVRTTTNSTVGEVVLINFDGNKADLTGTEIVLVDGKDGWENYNTKFYQCQKMGHYTSICPEKVEKDEGLQLLMDEFSGEDVHGL